MTDNKPLDDLQRKIDGLKEQTKEEQGSETGEGVGKAMRLGVELVAGVLVGSVIGFVIDRHFHTMPLFFIVCFFLGAAAGFRNMLRDNNSKE
jgi:ATP synthase protein I